MSAIPGPRSATPQRPPARTPPLGRGGRVVSYLLLAVLGVLCGFAGSLIAMLWLPVGLLLALAGCGALFYGGGLLTGTRTGAALPAVAWFVSLLYVTEPRPEGDFLLGASIGGYLLLFLGALTGVLCTARPGLGGGLRPR
ncbi:DUF6113 family protein [Streptacidiphilus monticola]|jgi:hypothetical protein|uniref:DUF6113 family protein n=1 Tax=Streptacidiphilus monticola TaxID=2161674 RepID=A0ABW1G9K7_9ACTN